MKRVLTLLIVEDREDDALLLLEEIRRGGFEPIYSRVETEADFRRELAEQKWDAIISDYNLPGFSGLTALSIVKSLNLHIPFILVSGTIGEDRAVQAMKAGAHDYIMKGKMVRLVPALMREIEDAELRARSEATIREREQQILQIQKLEAVGQLAGGLAHDFNNILGVIGLHVELILQNPANTSLVQSNALQILKAQERSAALVRQLLTFSRRQSSSNQVVHLNSLLEDARRILSMALGEQNELVFDFDQSLPSISADPVQLEQIFVNLAINARDAMPSGGRFCIETRLNTSKEYFSDVESIQISVRDNGCGMDEKTRHKIFEPFFTTKEVGKGTGLGLSTVFGIVQQHRGQIHVESEIGKGSCFQIFFPATACKADLKSESHFGAEDFSKGQETVLVVEDEEPLRGAICTILSSNGYRILEASQGLEATELGEEKLAKVDLVIADVTMPKMCGHEFVERLRRSHPDVPVLFISGHLEEGILNPSIDGESTHFLPKPFDRGSLLRKVKMILDERCFQA